MFDLSISGIRLFLGNERGPLEGTRPVINGYLLRPRCHKQPTHSRIWTGKIKKEDDILEVVFTRMTSEANYFNQRNRPGMYLLV